MTVYCPRPLDGKICGRVWHEMPLSYNVIVFVIS